MKRIVLLGLLALCAAGLVSAQMGPRGMGRWGYPPLPQPPAAEQTTVSGNLSIVRGSIALVSGDTTYYVGGLNRLIGFIEGLKEGARVSLEGAAYQLPNDQKAKILRVSKLTLNGKDYDLSPREPEGFVPQGFPPPPGRYNDNHHRYR
ncbi:MAG: hypothetical protein LBT87_09270 [Treponema sp.]|jgi:hypothetical protein|nr:hypothetical protein [Treponema sp.]